MYIRGFDRPTGAELRTGYLEPVWASAFGWLAIGDRLGPRGLCGAATILTAAVLGQLRSTHASGTMPIAGERPA